MEFAGEFESHLTVTLRDPFRFPELQNWAQEIGLKCLHIVLDRGDHPSQPMLTRRGTGSLTSELNISHELAKALNIERFEVSRIKLEASICNKDIPQSDFEAKSAHPNRYFEHHVKLLIDGELDGMPGLAEIAERHSAHLSRNALRSRSDHAHERFITQRVRGAGLLSAERQLKSLVEELSHTSHTIMDIEQEFVVFDSNDAMDRGWIECEA